jgi:hypothetical protein
MMGDITRYSQYERNTELNNENILEKCIKRCYSKSSKKQLLIELVDKLVEEIVESYDEDQDEQIFQWIMEYGTKKEKAFIDERLCADENAMHINKYCYEDYLDELPKFKAMLEKEEAEALAKEHAKNNYATAYNLAIGGK